MPRDPLTKEQIGELAGLLLDVFEYIGELKDEHSLAGHIQFPKIPSILSESLVVQLMRDRRFQLDTLDRLTRVDLGGREADIICLSEDGNQIRCEVKTTGSSGFQNFSGKDRKADLLVWVYFGKFFDGNYSNRIEFVLLEDPSLVFKETTKITYRAFKDAAGIRAVMRKFDPKEIWLPCGPQHGCLPNGTGSSP